MGGVRCLRSAALAVAVLVGFHGVANTATTAAVPLTVACSVQKPWCERMARAFEERVGVPVNVVTLSTGQALSRLQAEKDHPTVDVWWGGTGEPHLQAAAEGLTVAHKSHRVADMQPWSQRFSWVAGYRSVGIYTGILGYVYDTKAWEKTGLAAPRCWADLLQPAVRGRVQVADPRTSGTAYTFLTTILQLKGERRAWPWLKTFHAQVRRYTRSGSEPIQSVLRGDAVAGVVFLHDAAAAARAPDGSGAHLALVAPCEGTGFEIGAMSLVRGAPSPENARRFYELALTPHVQQLAAVAGALQTQSHRQIAAPEGTPRLNETKLIDHHYLTYGTPETRRRVIGTWVKVVGAAPLD